MSPRWRKVFRDLSSHRFRTMLVVLSIAIGIFAVGVVLGTREVLLREFDVDFAASVPHGVAYRTQDFGEEVVTRARKLPGVLEVQARHIATLRYTWPGSDKDRTLSVVAFSNSKDLRVDKVVPIGGAPWPPGTGEVVLEGSAKQAGKYKIGDVLKVERADGNVVDLRVVGFAHDINTVPAQFIGYETGYVSFDTMESLGESRQFNQLAIAFADKGISWPGASRLAVELRKQLFDEHGLRVFYTDVPKPGSHFLGDIFRALSLLLLAMGVLALGLSAFLVVNTVSSLMVQQVRQVGIMKSIGGSAGQLEWLYVVSVALYGVLAVLIGVPAAGFGGRWFTDFAARILNFRVSHYAPPWWVIAIEVAVGLIVPLAAAAIPVRRGTRMSVVRALNSAGMTTTHFGHRLTDRILGSIRGLPRPTALSLRNTFLRKGRLALTLSTLVLASGVVMAVFSVQASIESTIRQLESWWNYDVQVSFVGPQDAKMVVTEAKRVSGVKAVDTLRAYRATVVRSDDSENESFSIVGLDPNTKFLRPTLVEGRWLKPGDTNAVVINTDALNAEPSLHPGSTITLDVQGKKTTWKVVGMIKGQFGGSSVFCNSSYLAGLLGNQGVTRVLVRGTSSSAGAEQKLLKAVETHLKDAGIQVANANTTSGLADQLRSQLGILVAFLIIMAALLASVGVIGLTGTMTINVIESTREIGVMRATGAQHRSIYQIFVTEGLTVGFLAWLGGAVLAYPLSLMLVDALSKSIGIPLAYAFSWAGLGLWLVLMFVISGAASIAPAFRASQVSVRDAIAYE